MIETEIVNLVLKNGMSCVVMAFIVMCLVGIVKIFTKGVTEEKLVTENQKKWLAKLYLLLALVFSFVVNIFYRWVIAAMPVFTLGLVRDSFITWTVVSPLYQLYKQFGGRRLLIYIARLFKGQNKDADTLIDIIEAVLSEEAPLLTDNQKVAIETKLVNKLSGKKEGE